ncbi:hypothetical protein PMN64_07965 [Bradyrhizobium sp. UFLA01-814]|uniref:hypothetical protein n=1 Tax=Bradyrhizobium sp. UFLA01-814 TaxID=3023480 RepID=UPI00398A8FFF
MSELAGFSNLFLVAGRLEVVRPSKPKTMSARAAALRDHGADLITLLFDKRTLSGKAVEFDIDSAPARLMRSTRLWSDSGRWLLLHLHFHDLAFENPT